MRGSEWSEVRQDSQSCFRFCVKFTAEITVLDFSQLRAMYMESIYNA